MWHVVAVSFSKNRFMIKRLRCVNLITPPPIFSQLSALRENLSLVTALGDRAAQGRAFGNLGNTHYLLGNFRDAVIAHEQVSAGPGAASPPSSQG